MRFTITRGLEFGPAVTPALLPRPEISSIALYGDEPRGLKPRLAVGQRERVEPGQLLFTDRNNPAIRFLSPVRGVVREIRQGPRRSLQALVIDVAAGGPDWIEAGEPLAGFEGLAGMRLDHLRQRLQETGLWPSIRQRPGDRLAPSDGLADAVFITAIDTAPHAPPPEAVLAGQWDAFWLGAAALARFSRRATWVCTAPGFPPVPRELELKVQRAVFAGPHPAGLPGTHISRLAPLTPGRVAWHVGYQDVAAVGQLLSSGRLPLTRWVGVGGPAASEAGLVPAPQGALLSDLARGIGAGRHELVAGSLVAGRPAMPPFEHLGRFHRQLTLCAPAQPGRVGRRRLGGLGPVERIEPRQRRSLAQGMLPHDGLDRCWALDAPAGPLLRALMTGDHDRATALGCLDLAEEDLALASLACPGGHDYGAYLREALDARPWEAAV
jgi:Na+-transporting NADH:ubiquinone oxidoreductase subunit A